MLNDHQLRLIKNLAYVPEHLPDYFLSFSDADPGYDQGLIFYKGQNQLNIIAYPLREEGGQLSLEGQVNDLVSSLKPGRVQTVAPWALNLQGYKIKAQEFDFYSCLTLQSICRDCKLQNMLRRARQECFVDIGSRFTRTDLDLLLRFIDIQGFADQKAQFFHRLPDYLSKSEASFIVRAVSVQDKSLLAFSVFETGSRDYAFYLFNVTDRQKGNIPGVNDLLLDTGLKEVFKQGRIYLNTGLGITPGIERFKAKWGAVRFLPYIFQQFEPGWSWKKKWAWRNRCLQE